MGRSSALLEERKESHSEGEKEREGERKRERESERDVGPDHEKRSMCVLFFL